MKGPRSLHVCILEFIWYNQGGKFWKRSFNVKFNFARFSFKQNFLSFEKFRFVNNWFSFNAGNLFFSVVLFFSKKNIYRPKVAFKRSFDKICIRFFKKHCFPFLAVHANENLSCSVTLTRMKRQKNFSVLLNIVGLAVLAFQKV